MSICRTISQVFLPTPPVNILNFGSPFLGIIDKLLILIHIGPGKPSTATGRRISLDVEKGTTTFATNQFLFSSSVDTIHMTSLHMISMHPHAPTDTITALLNFNIEAVFCLDEQQKTPLDYARDYNVGGLVGMINGLCNHRNSHN